jgi:hypothetical protein
MRFLKLSVREFDELASPGNCEIWVLQKDSKGKYHIQHELKKDLTFSD